MEKVDVLERTDLKGHFWKLESVDGRQRWVFDQSAYEQQHSGDEFTPSTAYIASLHEIFHFDKTLNPNSGDKIFRRLKGSKDPSLPDWMSQSSNFSSSFSKKAAHASHKALHFYQSLQEEDGHWAGDYGGPLFLLPALIMVSHITETKFSATKQELMKIYMLNHQNQDGGWGLHIEGPSTMFGTVMQYCALRVLGMNREDEPITQARDWILTHGGATGIPSWGKFFLSLMGVYDWKGCNSLMPEMWLLPKWVPLHPWRYWCHARMVYLPMSYCYGERISAAGELTFELRKEIYPEEYDQINWSGSRNTVCEDDRFHRTPNALKGLFRIINVYESFPLKSLRKKALNFVLDYVNAEDEQTKYIDIGPVNQIINSLCVWHAYGADSVQFKAHVARWDDYLWLAEDGMKMNGYNGSQLWDTAFATQAILENQAEYINQECIERAYRYIDFSQIKEEVQDREKFFRHQSVGGWPFSTLDHGWPISDCTAEGLKAVLGCHHSTLLKDTVDRQITDARLEQAVDLILSFQNNDGGWATYENTRSGSYLELLNPSEVFGNIMIDYSWVECTSACITALNAFARDSDYKSVEIKESVRRGIGFIHSNQRKDGSWIGSWAVCFTYGTWFGTEALASSGHSYEDSLPLQEACNFLAGKQNKDGGWGESHLSCVTSTYSPSQQSQVVNTAWALLSLMCANYPDQAVIDKGIAFLIARQQDNGDWLQEGISGVFNQNCMITYTSYRNVFPIWAIGRYLRKYGNNLNYRGSHKNTEAANS